MQFISPSVIDAQVPESFATASVLLRNVGEPHAQVGAFDDEVISGAVSRVASRLGVHFGLRRNEHGRLACSEHSGVAPTLVTVRHTCEDLTKPSLEADSPLALPLCLSLLPFARYRDGILPNPPINVIIVKQVDREEERCGKVDGESTVGWCWLVVSVSHAVVDARGLGLIVSAIVDEIERENAQRAGGVVVDGPSELDQLIAARTCVEAAHGDATEPPPGTEAAEALAMWRLAVRPPPPRAALYLMSFDTIRSFVRQNLPARLPPLTACIFEVDLPAKQDAGDGTFVTATDMLTVACYRAFSIARCAANAALADKQGAFGSAVDLRRSLGLPLAYTGNAISFTLQQRTVASVAAAHVATDDDAAQRAFLLGEAAENRRLVELVRRQAHQYLEHCRRVTEEHGPSTFGSGAMGSIAEAFMGTGVVVTSWSSALALPQQRHPATVAAVSAVPFGGIGGATDGVVTIMPPRGEHRPRPTGTTSFAVHTGVVTAQADDFVQALRRQLTLLGGTVTVTRQDLQR